jgi:hypothetical protein
MLTDRVEFYKSIAAQAGVTLTEYAILIGLLGVLGIAGLKMLGNSTYKLLAGSNDTLANKSTLSLIQAKYNAEQYTGSAAANTSPVVTLKGSGYYNLVVDPETGQYTMKMVDGASGVATNVTSIDGERMNMLGSLMLANKLAQLAEEESDPLLKEYYHQVAEVSYYLGAAEGEIDEIAGLVPGKTIYGNGAALRDIFNYTQKLDSLLNNPPAGFTGQTYNEIMPLAVDVYNIAQHYENTFERFILPDGSFQMFTTPGTFDKPGGALVNSDIIANKGTTADRPYHELVKYEDLRAISDKILSDHKVDSVPVESTLADATVVYNTAEGAQASSP